MWLTYKFVFNELRVNFLQLLNILSAAVPYTCWYYTIILWIQFWLLFHDFAKIFCKMHSTVPRIHYKICLLVKGLARSDSGGWLLWQKVCGRRRRMMFFLMVLVIYGNFSVILARAYLFLKPLCSVPVSHTQSPQIFIISKNDSQKTILAIKSWMSKNFSHLTKNSLISLSTKTYVNYINSH